MRKLFLFMAICVAAFSAQAQMGIGTATPNAAAQLDVSSTTKGFLAPRMTQAQRDLISTSATTKGLLIYQTDGNAGFYYHDGTSWTSLAATSSSFVDLTTAQSVGGKKTFTSDDGFLATGTMGSGAASSLGAGTRMMWYPKNGAFRAGTVYGTNWDDANIGLFSIAMGSSTTASGFGSTAFGYSTTASGQFSTSMGSNTIASGQTSTALGVGTTASQLGSTAMGNATTASGQYSTAMGGSSQASGLLSTAMGSSTTASGVLSTAMGSSTTSNAVGSLAMGGNTIASGNFSTAMGYFTTAKSFLETAIGTYNTSYTPTSTDVFNATDRLFVIGNGNSAGNLSNALVMLKNGNTTFSGTVTATVVAPTSDARLKRNIVPIKNGIEAIMQLKPVSYEKKNSLSSTEYNIQENGFIAQELQKVMPTLVLEATDKDKLLSVNYTGIIPVLTKAIQEQQKAILEQQKAIQAQQKEIADLKKMVELLMKR